MPRKQGENGISLSKYDRVCLSVDRQWQCHLAGLPPSIWPHLLRLVTKVWLSPAWGQTPDWTPNIPSPKSYLSNPHIQGGFYCAAISLAMKSKV